MYFNLFHLISCDFITLIKTYYTRVILYEMKSITIDSPTIEVAIVPYSKNLTGSIDATVYAFNTGDKVYSKDVYFGDSAKEKEVFDLYTGTSKLRKLFYHKNFCFYLTS